LSLAAEEKKKSPTFRNQLDNMKKSESEVKPVVKQILDCMKSADKKISSNEVLP